MQLAAVSYRVVLLCAVLVHSGSSLSCNQCTDKNECSSAAINVVCDSAAVQQAHNLLQHINPTLATPPTAASEYQCFRLDMQYRSALTGSIVPLYQEGCTIKELSFCTATNWEQESKIFDCQTCESDNCNKGSIAPAETTTTTTGSSTTSSSDVSSSTTVSTTTEKGGAAAIGYRWTFVLLCSVIAVLIL